MRSWPCGPRNAGIYVGNDTIDRCTEYVKRCQNPDGGFAYMLPGGVSEFPRSAAGVVALYSAGIYEGDEIRRGLEYLQQAAPQSNAEGMENHFFYGHYYAAQAMWQAGGEHWRRYYPAIRDTLLERRKKDGSWFDQVCPEYGTAMACLILADAQQLPADFSAMSRHLPPTRSCGRRHSIVHRHCSWPRASTRGCSTALALLAISAWCLAECSVRHSCGRASSPDLHAAHLRDGQSFAAALSDVTDAGDVVFAEASGPRTVAMHDLVTWGAYAERSQATQVVLVGRQRARRGHPEYRGRCGGCRGATVAGDAPAPLDRSSHRVPPAR